MYATMFQALRTKMDNKQPNDPVDDKGYTQLKKGYIAVLVLLSTVKAGELKVDNKHCAFAIEFAKLLNNLINPFKHSRLSLIERELESVLTHYLTDIELLLNNNAGEKPELSGHLLLADVNRASCEYDVNRVEEFKKLLREICI